MQQYIIFNFNPSDWPASSLTIVGIIKDKRELSPGVTIRRISALPQTQQAGLEVAFQRFLAIDPGGKAAVGAIATKSVIWSWISDDEQTSTPCVELEISWLHPDATRSREIFRLTKNEEIALFDSFFTSEEPHA